MVKNETTIYYRQSQQEIKEKIEFHRKRIAELDAKLVKYHRLYRATDHDSETVTAQIR